MENTYTSSQIRNAAAALIKDNDDNIKIADPGYDTGYLEGVHDGLIVNIIIFGLIFLDAFVKLCGYH